MSLSASWASCRLVWKFRCANVDRWSIGSVAIARTHGVLEETCAFRIGWNTGSKPDGIFIPTAGEDKKTIETS